MTVRVVAITHSYGAVELRATANPNLMGAMDPAEFHTVVRQRYPTFARCFAEGRRRKPKLAGFLSIQLDIDGDGNVSSVSQAAKRTDIDDPRTIACIVDAHRKLHFEPPMGGPAGFVYRNYYGP